MAEAADIVVVGAGAAGLMAAIFAARAGGRVLLLERTHDGGRKILISGGGRCNVLPSTLEPNRFVTDSSPHTLRNLLRSWPLAEQRRFFEEDLGIPLALEAETGKLFPQSNRSRDVRDGLVTFARDLGVALRFDAYVVDLVPGASGPGAWRVLLADGSSIDAGSLIVATGGLSVPTTGSDGRGLALLRTLGHAVHEPYAALTPLTVTPPVHAGLSGISLPVTIRVAGTRWREAGGFLFTHRGYSGPAVLNASHHAVRSAGGDEPAHLLVQWSGRSATDWDEALRGGEGLVTSRLRAVLPERLAETLSIEAGLDPQQPIASLKRHDRHRLIAHLCDYRLPWSGDEGFRKAEVTGGGVALSEVDPRTLESRRCPGLFLCGELLDAFGPIGGHNFAWAWATGRLAGLGAGRKV
jgi:predicted Rossmann fold flavoprotein